ncbi:unnamed protein product [Gongylonema pulchrum]|uniref:CUB domain-containing protein n=1 Tax=Gongylonema pulchrum TaxID=637853 RepID=A0A183D7V2_9BILA|nr:unnamed protein product [Gongylonema pulchrum]
MNFGKNVDGQCTEGDHMLMGEIAPGAAGSTPLDYLPCRDAAAFPKEIPIAPGSEVLLEFYSDDSTADNGDGFRIEWSCENYFVLQV